jgi:hypothetical protein
VFAELGISSDALELLVDVREHLAMSDAQVICDSDGNDLDARFFVERRSEQLTVIIKSSGGGPTTLNRDYDEALRLIIERLGTVDALLLHVEVDSKDTAGLSAEARTIAIEGYQAPLLLSGVDSHELRRMIGAGAAKTARAPNATGGGNRRKRLRLFLAFTKRAAPSVDELTQVIRCGDWTEPQSRMDHAAEDRARPSPGRRRIGQGFERNPAVRLAVEEYAMVAAEQHYARANWTTQRCEHLNLGYDIVCTNGAEQLFVEVKGTRGDGSRVVITRNEAAYAHANYKRTELFVLYNVHVANPQAMPISCTGGESRIISEWDPNARGTLIPKDYYWYLPVD